MAVVMSYENALYKMIAQVDYVKLDLKALREGIDTAQIFS